MDGKDNSNNLDDGRFLRDAFRNLEMRTPEEVFKENMLESLKYSDIGTGGDDGDVKKDGEH